MIMAVTAKISTITTTALTMIMRVHGRPVGAGPVGAGPAGAGKDRRETAVSHQYHFSVSFFIVDHGHKIYFFCLRLLPLSAS